MDTRLGTKEEEAREKVDADQVFARSFAVARELVEDAGAEYAKRSTNPSRQEWGNFENVTLDSPVDAFRALADWRKGRDNVRDPVICDHLIGVYALATNQMFQVLTAGLGIEAGGDPNRRKQAAADFLDKLQVSIRTLDLNLRNVKIDPDWKPATQPEIFYLEHLRQSKTHGDRPRPPPPENLLPFDPPLPRKHFGPTDLWIGLAILSGLAVLFVLLRRK